MTVTRSFGVFFELCLNKRLGKQSWGWWFETLSRPLWRNCKTTNVHVSDCWQFNATGIERCVVILFLGWKNMVFFRSDSFYLKYMAISFVSAIHDTFNRHYNDVIMSVMASQITSLTIVYPTVYSGADQRKHQSSASLSFVRGIHRWPVNSPHKGPVTRKMFPFDDVNMKGAYFRGIWVMILRFGQRNECVDILSPEYDGNFASAWMC